MLWCGYRLLTAHSETPSRDQPQAQKNEAITDGTLEANREDDRSQRDVKSVNYLLLPPAFFKKFEEHVMKAVDRTAENFRILLRGMIHRELRKIGPRKCHQNGHRGDAWSSEKLL